MTGSVLFDGLLAAFFSFVVVVCVSPLVRWCGLRLGLLDRPDGERRLHSCPVPRTGGWALALAVGLGILLFLPADLPYIRGMLLAGSVIFAAGLLDDVYDLPAVAQFGAQGAAALVLYAYGVRIERLTNPLSADGVTDLGLLSLPATVVWVLAIVNAVNFTDGLDGLAAGMAGIASLSFAFISLELGNPGIAVLCMVVSGASFGFLRYNSYPASLFMGTTGSATLGLVLASITVEGTLKTASAIALVLPLLVLGVPFFDTSLAVARRLKNRVPVFRSDRGHVHHRLLNLGYTERQTVARLYIWCALMSALAVAVGARNLPATLVTAGAAGIVSVYMIRSLRLKWGPFRTDYPTAEQERQGPDAPTARVPDKD